MSAYFELDPDTISAEPGRFVDVDRDVPTVEYAEGLAFQPILGTDVLISVVTFRPHTEAPRHAHDEEQITIVIEGELEFEVGEERRTLRPGQMAVIPPNVPHGGRTHDSPCREIDVFNPPRRALLDLMEQPPAGGAPG